ISPVGAGRTRHERRSRRAGGVQTSRGSADGGWLLRGRRRGARTGGARRGRPPAGDAGRRPRLLSGPRCARDGRPAPRDRHSRLRSDRSAARRRPLNVDREGAVQVMTIHSLTRQTPQIVGATFALLVVSAAPAWWAHHHHFEATDDAQVEGHLHAINARVTGTVAHVNPMAENNHYVEAGTLL